ncbi:MAG: hypothetical protein KAT65_30020 [Methanophagales archaeon]|nr:hypothetical protein [Methanophagales archaeon]
MSRIFDWIFHENTESQATDKEEIERLINEKIELERKKEAERKNEISEIAKLLLSEIELIQKELKPLANCRNKAYNEYDDISEDDRLPDVLYFSSFYCDNTDKLASLNQKCIIKLVQYCNKITTIKKHYNKFEIIHDDLPEILSILELDEFGGKLGSPNVDEICKFLESTEDAYKLGEWLMVSLKSQFVGRS